MSAARYHRQDHAAASARAHTRKNWRGKANLVDQRSNAFPPAEELGLSRIRLYNVEQGGYCRSQHQYPNTQSTRRTSFCHPHRQSYFSRSSVNHQFGLNSKFKQPHLRMHQSDCEALHALKRRFCDFLDQMFANLEALWFPFAEGQLPRDDQMDWQTESNTVYFPA